MTFDVSDLPNIMQPKVSLELCPVANLPGFCWVWTGFITPKGYGHVYIDGVTQRAHRVSYEKLVGDIPDGLTLDHLCGVKPCINPGHLEPVTNLVNAQRTDKATKTHCIRGHELSGHNLIVKSPKSGGQRQCRECKRLSRAGLLTPVERRSA